MNKVKTLNEMLEAIGSSWKETRFIACKHLCEKYLLPKQANQFWFHILPEEDISKLKWNKKNYFDFTVYEMLLNAAEHGNKFKGIVRMRIHRGEKGLLVEIEDNGNGIPQKIADILGKETYNRDFLYNSEEGLGFHHARDYLDKKIVDGIGFNEKRNAVYLMALF